VNAMYATSQFNSLTSVSMSGTSHGSVKVMCDDTALNTP
jgi:hypothetical protein